MSLRLLRTLRLLRGCRGTTVIDVLVGLTVLSLAAGGIFAGFKGALNAWTIAQQVTGEQHNARMTLEWLVRRLRMAGQDYMGIPLSVASGSDVTFYGDINGSGLVECHRIYLNATTGIVYTASTEGSPPAACSGSVGQPLSAGVEARRLTVTGLTLRYFDDSPGPGVELTNLPLSASDRGRVRRIEVEIQVSGLQFLGPIRMATQVNIR